jgi:RNA polymerase sigma-70 factor, ECF subfamily
LPVGQIAAELRVPVGSVKAWLSRGRCALAAAMKEDDAGGISGRPGRASPEVTDA